MHSCPNCAAEIISGAKFCHRCGEKVKEKTKACPACQKHSPLASVFCHHCGFHYESAGSAAPKDYKPIYVLDFNPATLTEQVKALFFRSLRKRVEDEHDVARYSDYVERFYQSKFKEIYGLRAKQVAGDLMVQWERFGTEALPEIDRRIEDAFEGLLDYFIIQFCPDLNGMILPEGILKYERVKPGKTDQWLMIRDFLDLSREQETFYFDFIAMPEDYLRLACQSYLFAERKEKIFFLCDLSVKGNCKEGFAMTDRGIYWRAPFDKARKVLYQDLQEIKNGREWLTINGHFFTVNRTLNLKLYKLLKKLRGWPAHPVGAS